MYLLALPEQIHSMLLFPTLCSRGWCTWSAPMGCVVFWPPFGSSQWETLVDQSEREESETRYLFSWPWLDFFPSTKDHNTVKKTPTAAFSLGSGNFSLCLVASDLGRWYFPTIASSVVLHHSLLVHFDLAYFLCIFVNSPFIKLSSISWFKRVIYFLSASWLIEAATDCMLLPLTTES